MKFKILIKNQKILVALLTTPIVAFFCIVFLSYVNSYQSRSHLPILKVLTYSSFISPYGPAQDIQREFEKECECRLRWIEAEDSTLMVQKLQVRPDGLGIDMLLGLDQLTLFEAKKNVKWKNLSLYNFPWIRSAQYWVYSWAIPISWAPFTFISKKTLPPNSFQSLLNSKWSESISIPHPRSSTVGLQFYFWLYSQMKPSEVSKFLKKFKDQIYDLSHSWSSSYGLFQRDKSKLTFSYQTSLMYHEVEENKKYLHSVFKKGHPYQVEYVSIPATCTNCQLARGFIKFLLKPKIQKILMKKNYMLPVIRGVTPFERLQNLPLISYKKVSSFLKNKDALIQEWEKILD